MALKIIGSGLGRTGTKSMQTALNKLGAGPCYHMMEVFAHRECIPLWIEAGRGSPNWDAIFSGYHSTVDYPAASYWRELAAYYPDAKVLHTVRDPDEWFESTQATIFAPHGLVARTLSGGVQGPLLDFMRSFVGDARDHLHDRIFMTDFFRRHTEAVKAAIPPERLLIHNTSQGWSPLCEFVGAAIQADPYPWENDRAEFIARAGPNPGELPDA